VSDWAVSMIDRPVTAVLVQQLLLFEKPGHVRLFFAAK
jgi:hypothetical protein